MEEEPVRIQTKVKTLLLTPLAIKLKIKTYLLKMIHKYRIRVSHVLMTMIAE